MFLKAFIFPEKLSLGISLNSSEISYALVCKSKNDTYRLVTCGNGIPVWLSFFSPLFANTDLSNVPVIINTENIGQEDPDSWIERRESSSAKDNVGNLEIIREYVVKESTVYQIETSVAARNNTFQKLQKNFAICTFTPPLWKLAELYLKQKKKPFLLWKITGDGSIIAKIDVGGIEKICNFWPDSNDLQEKPEQVLEELTPLLNSLSLSEKLPVIVYSPEKDFSLPENFKTARFSFENPPEIKGISLQDQEAYSLACTEKNVPNFVPFEKIQAINRLKSVWNSSVIVARWVVFLILTSFIIMMGIDKTSDLYMHFNREKLANIKEKIDELQSASVKLDSVMMRFKEKAGFIADESRITELLSAFQEIFPEGMWAEEITASDIEDRGYQIDIRAIASSSGMIGNFMEKLSSVKGISECRMVYSEQIPAKQIVKGIRVKIQAVWK